MTTRGTVTGRDDPARVVDPRGRAKAYRPLDASARRAAFERGLAAYAGGRFYLAHEELEPAWMGTADPAERELLAGLIKLAAAFVHATRGNPAGVRTNLVGARQRIAGAEGMGVDLGLDLPALLAAIDGRLQRLAALPASPVGRAPGPPHDVAGPPVRARRSPLDLEPPTLTRRTTA